MTFIKDELIELGCKCEVPWRDAFSPQQLTSELATHLKLDQYRFTVIVKPIVCKLHPPSGGWLGSSADEGRVKPR